MRKFNILILILFTIQLSNLNAQVGIGTTLPEGILDIKSTSEGILLPRVSLTNLFVEAPVVNPQGGGLVVSALVFHDGSNSINEGL